MKKCLIVLFLVIISTTKIFAVEIIPKIGWIFVPHINNAEENVSWNSPEGTFSYGGDVSFQIGEKLYLGPGVMLSNSHKIQNINDLKFNFTNIYISVKLKFNIKYKDSTVTIYPFIHLGGSILSYTNMPEKDEIKDFADDNHTKELSIYSRDCKGLLYYALGCGIEYKSVVLEFLYGINSAEYTYECYYREITTYINGKTIKEDLYSKSYDITYSAFRIQIGYKFSL